MAKAWKEAEARIAALFGHIRRPLSGNSRARIGKSDTMTKDGTRADIFLEIKHRQAIPFLRQIKEVQEKAESEKTPWMFVIHQKGDHRSFAIIDVELAAKLWACWQEYKRGHLKPASISDTDRAHKLEG